MIDHRTTRRDFLAASAAAGSGLLTARTSIAGVVAPSNRINVIVWDERQPAQKQAYDNFLGNRIADHLGSGPGISVKSVGLDEPEQGLGSAMLDDAQVLIWWGHVRQREIPIEIGKKIVSRIKDGKLGLIALHSAHWSTPFIEAMDERSRIDARKKWSEVGEKVEIDEIPPVNRHAVPGPDARPTPWSAAKKFPEGRTKVELHLPVCVFPTYGNQGNPSFSKVLADHPITHEIPRSFELPRTEMYNEPFHVPEPDLVLIEERWEGGEWFRSAMVWEIGKGKVFYYRPGHETYAVYKEPVPLRILTNAVRWIAETTR